MLVEIKVKDTIIEKLKQDQSKNSHDLKVLNAVIRLPRMANDFHRALRRRYEADKMKGIEEQAIKVLRHEGINDKNNEEYFDNFIKNLDRVKELNEKARNSMIEKVKE